MQQSNCKVFIGGLSYDTTDESLSNYFRQFGQIKDAIVMRTPQGQSRGFGFCVFQNAQVCQTVLKTKSHIIDNRRVDVRMALSKDEAPPPQSNDGATKLNHNKIFVGGLHYQTTPNELKDYFSQFGEVETSTVVYNHDNKKSRGFGFIIFKENSSVQQVLSLPEHIIMDRKVEVKKAIPKDLDDSNPPNVITEPAKSFNETPKLKPSAYYPPRFSAPTYPPTLYDYTPLYPAPSSTSLWSTHNTLSAADSRPLGYNESLLPMHSSERHFEAYSVGSSLGVASYGESMMEPSPLFLERNDGLDQRFW